MPIKAIFQILIISVCLCRVSYAQQTQTIKGFYLSNYAEDGSCDWEVKGKEAVVQDNFVFIDSIEAKYFSKEDTISVRSEKAQLNKDNMNILLKDNVHIENKSGMTMKTDSLNWEKDKNKLATDDQVKVENKNMQVVAKGLTANTDFKKVDFEKDVKVSLPDKDGKAFMTVTCSGPLEIEYNTQTATFHNHVVAESQDATLWSDKATVFFDYKAKKLIKIVSEGHVKILKDENVTLAEKATYLGEEKRIILEGNPRLIYFPKENEAFRN